MSTIASVPSHGVVFDTVVDTTKPTSDGHDAQPEEADATASSESRSDNEQSSELTMTEHHYRYKVQMTCGGCSGAVTRVLNKAQETGAGVNSFTVSLENQSVDVYGTIGFDDLTLRIQKTGKKILEGEEVTETPEEAPAAPEVETTAQPVAVA